MKIVDKKDETIVDSEEKTRHIGNHDVKIVDMKEVSISDVCLYSDQHDICAIFVFSYPMVHAFVNVHWKHIENTCLRYLLFVTAFGGLCDIYLH